ncbi:MAG: bacteriophage holin [Gammaproteobacteria bacterium]
MKNDVECVKAKLCPVSFGLAVGVIKGLWLLLLAWAGWLFGYGMPAIEHIAKYYHGYAGSFQGGLIGGFFGFISGFIFGFIFAGLYDFFLCRGCMKCGYKGKKQE